MATTRKTAAPKTTAAAKTTTPRRKPAAPKVEVTTAPVSEAEKQAKLEAYHALKSAGVAIPQELQVVETWIAEIKAQREAEARQLEAAANAREAELAEANKNGPWYVRNGYPAPFNLRLDRQTEKRRIELKPRGTPGDLHPLKEEDLKDPVIRQNVNLGLIEVIPAGEANLVIEKQMTNSGTRTHTPLAILRNERNEAYKQGAVRVEAEFNSQGVTVAHIDPRAQAGQLTDKEVARSGAMTRVQPGTPVQAQAVDQATSVVHSSFVPTGGQPAAIQYGMGSDAHAKAVDDIARRKNIQGPQAGLGDVQVVVNPVQRT